MKFSSFLLVCLLALTGVQVEAKRFGAGRSMGQQSGNVTNREATRATTAKAPQVAPSVTPSSPPLGKTAMAGRSWGGVLGGVAAFGLVGLFVGPVVLAIMMAVWREWLGQQVRE